MLAQLPPHAVAKKVDNYEHLDLLWGQDVDKVVFPHVLEFLKTYAEPVSGSKAAEAEAGAVGSEPPAYSKRNAAGLRKRDTVKRDTEVSYAKVAGGDVEDRAKRVEGISFAPVASENVEDHSKRLEGVSYAQVAAENTGNESDSDQTMGDEHHEMVQPGVSFADALKSDLRDDSGTTAEEEADPGIAQPVTEDISYADMAAK
jgi:hypothetical protein